MLLAEVRVLSTNELIETFDITEETDQEGVARAIGSGVSDLDCVVIVDRDEPLGDVTTPNPAPEAAP